MKTLSIFLLLIFLACKGKKEVNSESLNSVVTEPANNLNDASSGKTTTNSDCPENYTCDVIAKAATSYVVKYDEFKNSYGAEVDDPDYEFYMIERIKKVDPQIKDGHHEERLVYVRNLQTRDKDRVFVQRWCKCNDFIGAKEVNFTTTEADNTVYVQITDVPSPVNFTSAEFILVQ